MHENYKLSMKQRHYFGGNENFLVSFHFVEYKDLL